MATPSAVFASSFIKKKPLVDFNEDSGKLVTYGSYIVHNMNVTNITLTIASKYVQAASSIAQGIDDKWSSRRRDGRSKRGLSCLFKFSTSVINNW